jgi:hypothetical protein
VISKRLDGRKMERTEISDELITEKNQFVPRVMSIHGPFQSGVKNLESDR